MCQPGGDALRSFARRRPAGTARVHSRDVAGFWRVPDAAGGTSRHRLDDLSPADTPAISHSLWRRLRCAARRARRRRPPAAPTGAAGASRRRPPSHDDHVATTTTAATSTSTSSTSTATTQTKTTPGSTAKKPPTKTAPKNPAPRFTQKRRARRSSSSARCYKVRTTVCAQQPARGADQRRARLARPLPAARRSRVLRAVRREEPRARQAARRAAAPDQPRPRRDGPGGRGERAHLRSRRRRGARSKPYGPIKILAGPAGHRRRRIRRR